MNLKSAQRMNVLQNGSADTFVRLLKPSGCRRTWLSALLTAALTTVVYSVTAQSTNGTDAASFQIIGQRNIFDPNRVPHTRSGASAVPRIVDSFSFVGTMSYAKGHFAFFDGTSPDFRKVLEPGGDIAGFKVTALAARSVTLLSGTNEIVLPMGGQMRRDDDGNWILSSESAAYADAGSPGSGRHRGHRNGAGRNNFSATSATAADHLQADNSSTTEVGAGTGTPDASAAPGGNPNDPLTRLMQQRAREQQQLGQGQ